MVVLETEVDLNNGCKMLDATYQSVLFVADTKNPTTPVV